jgi:probable HAF family extracellular repeat protein
VLTLLCVAALQPAVGQSFTIKDLGNLPGGIFSVAKGINDRGQIVGDAATDGFFVPHAFLFEYGAMVDLGTLPGGTFSEPSSVNNRGQVVGEANTASGDIHAFLFENGAMVDLGTLPGGSFSRAAGINDRGQVVGSSSTANRFEEHAFLFENGVMVDRAAPLGAQYQRFQVGERLDRFREHQFSLQMSCAKADQRFVLPDSTFDFGKERGPALKQSTPSNSPYRKEQSVPRTSIWMQGSEMSCRRRYLSWLETSFRFRSVTDGSAIWLPFASRC